MVQDERKQTNNGVSMRDGWVKAAVALCCVIALLAWALLSLIGGIQGAQEELHAYLAGETGASTAAALETSLSQTGTNVTIALIVAGVLLLVAAALLLRQRMNREYRRNTRQVYYRDQLFQLMSKHIDDAFLFLSGTGRCEYVSANVERVLGIAPAAFEGAQEWDALSYLGNEIEVNIKGFCESGSKQPFVQSFDWKHRANAETRALLLCCYPISPADGSHHYVVMLSDRTVERNAQRLMRSAMKAAEAASETKTRFLSSMSHEIRTPLNAVIGMTRIALGAEGDLVRIIDCLHKIDGSSRHLLELINDVLDMSRIESGTTTIASEPFSLTTLLGDLMVMQRTPAEAKDVALILSEGTFDSDWLVGDFLRVNQVLINIIGNAIKFTPPGGSVRLAVEQTRRSDNALWIRFTITDTGIGMPEEFLPKLFEAFTQAQTGAEAVQYGGTGLGMSITKNLVTLMNGTINVRSAIGEGTTFIVEIAFPIADPAEQEKREADEKPDEAQLAGLRVLLAEDNLLNTEIMLAMLEALKVEAQSVTDGKQAVEAFARSAPDSFDCILMDIQMPVMDGLAATRTIREMKRMDAQRIPIIAITANAFREDVTRSLDSGMNDHISKPVDPKNLATVMARVMQRHGRR